MSCGLKELNKENVLSILDSNVRELEHMEKEFEKKATTDADINQLGKVIFALYRVKSIRADIRELEENTTYSSIQIRELLDKINLKYSTDLKLHSKNGQTGVLTEDYINMVKYRISRAESPDKIFFREYAHKCTYCESCEDICEQHAIWIINPEWEELQ